MNPTARVVVDLASSEAIFDAAAMADTVTALEAFTSATGFSTLISSASEAQDLVDWLYAYLDGSIKGTVSFHMCTHAYGEAGTGDCSKGSTFVRIRDGAVTVFGGVG